MNFYKVKLVNEKVKHQLVVGVPKTTQKNVHSDNNLYYYFDNVSVQEIQMSVGYKSHQVIYPAKHRDLLHECKQNCKNHEERVKLDNILHNIKTLKQQFKYWEFPLLYICYHHKNDCLQAKMSLKSSFYVAQFCEVMSVICVDEFCVNL